MFKPTRIIIHHSATADSKTLSWSAIRRFHLKNKWSDIGYHAGCEYVRDSYEVLFGRPDTKMGAHTKGHNGDSLGFCFVGDFDKKEPPEAQQYAAIERCIIPWMLRYDIPVEEIHGHRDYSTKTCPGSKFDMDRFRDMVKERLP